MNKETRLRECPCCRGEAKEIYYRQGSGGLPVSRVRCTKCGLQTRIKRDRQDAFTEWNTRPTPDKGIRGALEAAKGFIENGVALGFIRMPDKDVPDPAHKVLPAIIEALDQLKEV